jgi:hypothetical protein
MKVARSPLFPSLILAGLLIVAAGCGPSASVCGSYPCSTGKQAQFCEDSNGNVTYRFNGMSCSCNAHDPNTTACDACTSEVDAYCYAASAP